MNTIVLRSDDGGAHFIPLKGDPDGRRFPHACGSIPKNPDRRILGVDQGTLVTLNGGKTWSSWYNQPTGAILSRLHRQPLSRTASMARSRIRAPPRCRAAATASATASPWREFHEVTAGGESDEIAPDPDDPDIVYGGRVDRLDLKSGQTRNVDPTLAFPASIAATWTLPLTFGKRDHALYFGNQRIFRTTRRRPDTGSRSAPT